MQIKYSKIGETYNNNTNLGMKNHRALCNPLLLDLTGQDWSLTICIYTNW